MNNNASWRVSEDAPFKLQGHDFFTQGIDYVSTNDTHWDKVEIHDLTAEGATGFAKRLVEALNKAEGI